LQQDAPTSEQPLLGLRKFRYWF